MDQGSGRLAVPISGWNYPAATGDRHPGGDCDPGIAADLAGETSYQHRIYSYVLSAVLARFLNNMSCATRRAGVCVCGEKDRLYHHSRFRNVKKYTIKNIKYIYI